MRFLNVEKKRKPHLPQNTAHSRISETTPVPAYECFLMPCTLCDYNRYMCGVLTTTALWWVPRLALLGCSPKPDPSCPSYCGGLFQCTPSPEPSTRWAAEPHKYFLFTAAATQSWLQNCVNYFGLFSVAPCGHLCASQLWFPTVLKCEMSIHLCPQEVPRVNIHYFHWCLTAVLKLLRSPGKDCPRFSAMMTETFESHPYQKFLKAHQVRQRPSPHSQTYL